MAGFDLNQSFAIRKTLETGRFQFVRSQQTANMATQLQTRRSGDVDFVSPHLRDRLPENSYRRTKNDHCQGTAYQYVGPRRRR